MAIVGDLTLNSGSTWVNEVNAAGASDLVTVTGALTIGPNVTLDVSLDSGIYTVPTLYTIATAASVGGTTFAHLQTNAVRYNVAVLYNVTSLSS